ncbi:MAG: hypothetical protein JST12_19225 [Armatimonadetes bacterium]|nr:hypothetical protein [Armatimonadota bacterium]
MQVPALAKAVRTDWSGLTETDYRDHLINDIHQNRGILVGNAFDLLAHFFPKDAEDLAVKMLNRPLYDDSAVYDLIGNELIETDDPLEWRQHIGAFKRRQSALLASLIPFCLFNYNSNKEIERQILRKIYPDFNPIYTPMPPATTLDETLDLLRSIEGIHSESVDKAVQGVFQRTLDFHVSSSDQDIFQSGQTYKDLISLEAVKRMVGKGFDSGYLNYFKLRVRSMSANPSHEDDNNNLKEFKDWITRLSK